MPTTTNLAIYCAIFNGNTQLSRVLLGEPIYFLSYFLGPVRLQYNVSIRLTRSSRAIDQLQRTIDRWNK
jgi:hypothetical protein